jgi:hypothetical protein
VASGILPHASPTGKRSTTFGPARRRTDALLGRAERARNNLPEREEFSLSQLAEDAARY